MQTQKAENLLNLAYNATPTERSRSGILSTAISDKHWEIITKSSRSLSYLTETHPQIQVTSLIQNYSILNLPRELIPFIASLDEVTFIEMPKRIFFSVNQGILASCINYVTRAPLNLTGHGILVGIIDSGIDTTHPDFRNEDGTTRIVSLWDQTAQGAPPSGYQTGTEYTAIQINEALTANREISTDTSGHGTAVAGIAAGNGRASNGRFRGVAPEASLIVVKMRQPSLNSFPRTSELMTGINYCVTKAIELNMPLALNLSFGNNYGAHTGTSLIETFLDQAASLGRTSIITGSGNEGASPIHTSGILTQNSPQIIEFSIGPREAALDLQLWKNYADEFSVEIITPSGNIIGPLPPTEGPQRYIIPGATLLVYYGTPLPYQFRQEIFMDFIPSSSYLPTGIWRIRLTPRTIKSGDYDMWLPGGGILNTNTRFLTPTPQNTLTIPSTASGAISVGAYNAATRQFADFSGRGLTIKPDLVAPGVNITAPASPGGYQTFTGTSFAAPFVTGSAALLMQWGIILGNDPYLYGEKLKAVLARSARQLFGYSTTPNPQTGYGALCLEDIFL